MGRNSRLDPNAVTPDTLMIALWAGGLTFFCLLLWSLCLPISLRLQDLSLLLGRSAGLQGMTSRASHPITVSLCRGRVTRVQSC